MAESIASKNDEDDGTSFCAPDSTAVANGNASRKVKRKAAKKEKRKQIRKELAEKARTEEETRLNDPEEQRRIQLEEERENERLERDRREFEEREKQFLEELARKKAEEEEEERKRAVEEKLTQNQVKEENDLNEDDEWEYVEEGPPEIIWQGNEIIVKKNRVKVKKEDSNKQIKIEHPDRPTSNPLPPQSEAYTAYKDASKLSAQQLLENVAQQVPNFGTEQDKAHCPFHIKTGACRFGLRCSRVHFYPDKSCTLLVKNMYAGPGLAWEQDEGLEYMDEEVERYYEEFYEDVHTEFLKFGEIVNFKVCRNGSFHLRGNVYIHYISLESAVLAYHAVNGRYFAGKQVNCEFVSVTKWRIAICGEYLKSRLKTCSRGTACNFLHCFGNPGGDYEWADWDRPPPRYWVKKMTALFGHSDEYWHDRDLQMEQESPRERQYSSGVLAADRYRYHSRRSTTRDADRNGSYSRSLHEEHDFRKSAHQKHTPDDRKQLRSIDQKHNEEETNVGNNQHGKNLSSESDSDGGRSVRDTDRDGYHDCKKRRSRHDNKKRESRDYCVASRSRTHEHGSGEDLSISDRGIDKYHSGSRKRSSHRKEVPDSSDNQAKSEHSIIGEERARKRSRSSRRGRSSSEDIKGSSPEELIKSAGNHDTNSSSRSRLKIKSNDSDSRHDNHEDADNVGHQESDKELHPDKHKRSKRKSTIDGNAESKSARRYYERHKSHDAESVHHDEDNGERVRWKPDKSPPEKDHHKSFRNRHRQSTESRSRGSRWSSRERRSDSLEGVGSTEELQKADNKRSGEKHRSHGHTVTKGEQKKSTSEKHT